jgi:hypothetical protein
MGVSFEVDKKKPSKTRKLPFLPRVGIYVDFGGREFVYKQTSLLETALNLQERGITMANWVKLMVEQFAEIEFPTKKKGKTITTSARTISIQRKKR